ncbi:hypothetical protein [Alicyclobacillus herbarius]|uniref:hypothetical protein n=1 Tax=Alicyclobacillus herbarius TaxID=122960 RepID=UPI0012DDE4F1|nr:hypothetical protein [Alicyclobacillus herbarius]
MQSEYTPNPGGHAAASAAKSEARAKEREARRRRQARWLTVFSWSAVVTSVAGFFTLWHHIGQASTAQTMAPTASADNASAGPLSSQPASGLYTGHHHHDWGGDDSSGGTYGGYGDGTPDGTPDGSTYGNPSGGNPSGGNPSGSGTFGGDSGEYSSGGTGGTSDGAGGTGGSLFDGGGSGQAGITQGGGSDFGPSHPVVRDERIQVSRSGPSRDTPLPYRIRRDGRPAGTSHWQRMRLSAFLGWRISPTE